MSITQPNSYLEFLSHIIGSSGKGDPSQYISSLPNLKHLHALPGAAFFITDLTRKKYIHINDCVVNVTGYQSGTLISNGLDFYLSNIPGAEFELYNSRIFPEYIRFLHDKKPETYPDFIFSRNNRLKTSDGKFVNLLQKFCFIADPLNGMPSVVTGTVSDITHFKTDNSIVHTIEQVTDSGTLLVAKKVFWVSDGDRPAFSKKEIEILKCMRDGLSSKQIADKYNKSVYTINNQRKSMLQKAHCKNSVELMHYANAAGLI